MKYKAKSKVYHGDIVGVIDDLVIPARNLGYTLDSPELKDCFVALNTAEAQEEVWVIPLNCSPTFIVETS